MRNITLRRLFPAKDDFIPFTLSLIPFAYLLFLLVRYAVDVPVWDQWHLVLLLEKSYSGDLSLRDLWAQHNEHRILFPRMIMLFLARVSGWNIFYEIAVNVILAVGIFAVVSYQARKTNELIGMHGTNWLLPMLSLIVFSIGQWRNWVWGWQIQIFLNVLAFVSSVTLLAHPVFSWWRFTTAMFLGVVATYSFANGVLFWPIGLFILSSILSCKRTRKYALVLLLFLGASTLATYLYDYHKPLHHPSIWYMFVDPISYIKYVLVYLGSPIGSFNPHVAILTGSFGLCIFVTAGTFCLHTRYIRIHAVMPWICLGLYSILSAMLTGIGRVGFDWLQAMRSRYVTISSLLWIANFLLLYVVVRCIDTDRAESGQKTGLRASFWMPFLLFVVVAGFLPMLFLTSLGGAHRLQENHDNLLPARAELLSGENDQMLHRLCWSADFIKERMPVLRRHKISIFRER